MPSRLIQTFVLVLYVFIAKFAVPASHTWMLVRSHKFASVTSVTNKYFLLPLVLTVASVLVHRWRSSAAPAGGGEGPSCPNEAVAAQATQSRAGSPYRDGMTERPLQAGAVVILLLLPFDHPSDLFTSSRYPLSGALWIIH